MRYLLDSNVCIHNLRKKGNPLVKMRLAAHSVAELALCTVVTGELRHGAMASTNPVGNLADVELFVVGFAVFPFDEPASAIYAKLRTDLEVRGESIGPLDTMIAAIALAHGLTM